MQHSGGGRPSEVPTKIPFHFCCCFVYLVLFSSRVFFSCTSPCMSKADDCSPPYSDGPSWRGDSIGRLKTRDLVLNYSGILDLILLCNEAVEIVARTPTSLQLSVSDVLAPVNFPAFAMADRRRGGSSLSWADRHGLDVTCGPSPWWILAVVG